MTLGDPKLPDRFWRKVKLDPDTQCWNWIGCKDPKGYGRFWYRGKNRWAHRVTKRFRRTAHHTCYNTSCVNPEHLQDVSRAKNSHFGHAPEYDSEAYKKYESYYQNHYEAQGVDAPF